MIAVNAFSQMAALGLVLVIQTVYSILVARSLGPDDFGRFSFVWSIVQILLMGGDLGMHNTALREISHTPASSEAVTQVFAGLKVALALLLLVVTVVIDMLVRDSTEMFLAMLLFGVGMVFHSLTLGISVMFQAHGRLYWASLNIVLIFAVQAALGLSLLLAGGKLIALSLAYLVAALAGLVVNFRLYSRKVHPIRIRWSAEWKSFLRKSLPVGLGTLFHTTSSRIGISLLTLLAGSYSTGVFSAAYRIPSALGNIPIGIFSAILPVMAAQQGNAVAVRSLFGRSLLLMFGLSFPLAAAFYYLAAPIIEILYGDQYAASIEALQILTWSLIPTYIGMAFSHVILSQGSLVSRLPWITGTAMVVSLILNLVLIPELAETGTALTVVATETLLMLLYALAVRRFLFQ